MKECGWWIKRVVVTDKTVSFYIGVAGNSWTVNLKNNSGQIEASTNGASYGDHSLQATSYGTHTLELNCSWKSSYENPCESCTFDIPAPISIPEIPGEIPPYQNPSLWTCDPSGNQYETDQYGYSRKNVKCPPDAVWICNIPADGLETNQYGYSRKNVKCNEITSPETTPGTTPDIPQKINIILSNYMLYIVLIITIMIIFLLRR